MPDFVFILLCSETESIDVKNLLVTSDGYLFLHGNRWLAETSNHFLRLLSYANKHFFFKLTKPFQLKNFIGVFAKSRK